MNENSPILGLLVVQGETVSTVHRTTTILGRSTVQSATTYKGEKGMSNWRWPQKLHRGVMT